MTIHRPPHRPTKGEIAAARMIDLPNDEEYARSMLDLAGAAFNAGAHSRAIDVLKGLALSRPNDARIYEALAAVYQVIGQPEEAELCFRAALDCDPDSLRANVNLGEMEMKKDPALARLRLARVIELDPKGPFSRRAEATLRRIRERKVSNSR
jgi:Flp pilus assembly protein TadD